MSLADVWMLFTTIFLTAYVVLDGYDLGIGMLTLLDRNVERRRQMHALVSWLWDGNESWLVMLALAGWAGVPLVFGVALPALYVPLVVMLFALIARGVSIELLDQHQGWHPLWGPVFGVASFVAAFCQGAAFGGLVAGLPVRGTNFSGGTFTFLHSGYALLTGFTAVALYALAGSAYLYLKSRGELQRRAAGTGTRRGRDVSARHRPELAAGSGRGPGRATSRSGWPAAGLAHRRGGPGRWAVVHLPHLLEPSPRRALGMGAGVWGAHRLCRRSAAGGGAALPHAGASPDHGALRRLA